MDSRHPQHPSQQQQQQHGFSRNNPSAYSHAPYQPNQNQAPFPSASHVQNAPPQPPPPQQPYQEHHRRPSDNPYYAPSPAYPRDAAPMPSSNHTRHHSTSSVGHGTPINRNMPPPSSPQQQHQQHAQHQHPNQYPPPPMSRGPPPSIGPPVAFPAGRDLPSLSSINRPGSVNSSMSISSMLGGPPPTSRESAPPQSQYSVPTPTMSSAAPPSYGHQVHASPRSTVSAAPDFGRFARPRTPEHRLHEPAVRDHRSNSAGSPPRPVVSTPEAHRYATPQPYAPRNPAAPHGAVLEERRDPYPNRVPNPNAMPPRPNSQPVSYSGPPPTRVSEPSRMNEPPRGEAQYGRQVGYPEREDLHSFRERQRMEEEVILRQERDRRDRMGYPPGPPAPGPPGIGAPHEPPSYGRAYNQPQPGQYVSPHDSRDPSGWIRRDPPPSQPHEPPAHQQPPPQASAAYDYQRPPAQAYAGRPGEQYGPPESRFPQGSYNQPPPQAASAPPAHYGSPPQARRVAESMHQQQQQQQQQSMYHNGQPPSTAPGQYRPQHESPRMSNDDRNLVRLQQDSYRKGRNSPLPQAVQGAQGQIGGPGSEPGIKNEFGKMFSGIGSGVGAGMASQSGASGTSQTPFSNAGQLRRDDLENVVMQDATNENGAPKRSRSRAGAGGSRKRKLKDEDSREGDDSSTGRRTPGGRRKAKTVNGGSGLNRQSTSNRYDVESPAEPTPQPVAATFKATPAQPTSQAVAHESKAPVPHHHHINRHHHHHHHHGVAHSAKPFVPIPKPKQIVRSHAVLDSVRTLPRVHLGHMIYETKIVPEDGPDTNSAHPSGRGYKSQPVPLPRFEGKENCTFTVRIPRVHLGDDSREELTAGRAVWGTDVYTDDSDVIAACIHSGWVRGAWPESVDVSLLGLDIEPKEQRGGKDGEDESALSNGAQMSEDVVLTEPPLLGPMSPIPDRDLHVTILLLPALEKYASTVRYGIKSREWQGSHDGLSYMILSIKWVSGVDTANEAGGKARRKRMKLSLSHEGKEELDSEKAWGGFLTRGNGHVGDESLTDSVTQESWLRGPVPGVNGNSAIGDLKALGAGGWWKERPEKVRARPVAEVEVKSIKTVEAEVAELSEAEKQAADEAERQRQRENEQEAANSLADLSAAVDEVLPLLQQLQPEPQSEAQIVEPSMESSPEPQLEPEPELPTQDHVEASPPKEAEVESVAPVESTSTVESTATLETTGEPDRAAADEATAAEAAVADDATIVGAAESPMAVPATDSAPGAPQSGSPTEQNSTLNDSAVEVPEPVDTVMEDRPEAVQEPQEPQEPQEQQEQQKPEEPQEQQKAQKPEEPPAGTAEGKKEDGEAQVKHQAMVVS